MGSKLPLPVYASAVRCGFYGGVDIMLQHGSNEYVCIVHVCKAHQLESGDKALERSTRAARSHRRYLPVDERACATGDSFVPPATSQFSRAVDGARAAKSHRTRSPTGRAESLQPYTSGRRLVRGAARARDPLQRRPCTCTAEREWRLRSPWHFYDFAPDGFLVVSRIASEMDFSRGLAGLLVFFN
jgi:hypothetical protein